jgi:hypothetical protein
MENETYIQASMITHPIISSSDTYRRGQVEWALWRMSTIDRQAPKEPSPVFRNRIKRLLEIDRTGASEASRKGKGQLAFSEDRPEGTGFDVAFTAYDAFILALGLDLLRMGFVQSEVVMLMNFLRPRLGKTFGRILQNPPDPERRSARAKRHPVKPEQDRRVFLLLERVEASEEFPTLHQSGRGGDNPIYREPTVCQGLRNVAHELDRMDQVFRRALVLDLAHTAVGLSKFLAEAPEIRRGRPSSIELASV